MRPPRIMPVPAPHDRLSDLRLFRLFEHFPEPSLAVLAQLATSLERKAGESIYSAGDTGHDPYIIVAGGVELRRETPVGEQTVSRVRVGQMFGEESLADGGPRAATAIAAQDAAFLRIDAAGLRRAQHEMRELEVAMLRSLWNSLAIKLRQANAFMGEIAAVGHEPPSRGHQVEGEAVSVQPSAKLRVLEEKGLAGPELKLLATTAASVRFPPDAVIFCEGDAGETMYVVLEGEVRISRRLPGFGEEALSILGRGDVFGEMALVDELPRSADALAHAGGCTLLRLERGDVDDVLRLEKAAAPFLQLLCRILARRFRAMVTLLVNWRVMAGFG